MNSEPKSTSTTALPSRLAFQYLIASGDMRFIERTERSIVIIGEGDIDWVIRGEVEGCGEACHANLSQIFLEYLMSCEGCGDQQEVDLAIDMLCDISEYHNY